MIVLIIGLPGSGKSGLARAIRSKGNPKIIRLNGDKVRADISADLGWSHADRISHAFRMGAMARLLSDQGFDVVVDFVCPTEATRAAFGPADICVWMNTIEVGRYLDTNEMWEPPSKYSLRIDEWMMNDARLVLDMMRVHKMTEGLNKMPKKDGNDE